MHGQSIPTLLLILLLALFATAQELKCNKYKLVFTSSFEDLGVWTLHKSPPTGVMEITPVQRHSGKKSLYAAWDPAHQQTMAGTVSGGSAEATLPAHRICAGCAYKFSAWTLAPSMGAYVNFSIDSTPVAQTPMTPAGFGRWYKIEGTWVAPPTVGTPAFKGVLTVSFILSRELTAKIDKARVFVNDITLAA